MLTLEPYGLSSRIRVVERDNLRDLLGIRRMDKVPNEQIRDLCRVAKGLDERINSSVLCMTV